MIMRSEKVIEKSQGQSHAIQKIEKFSVYSYLSKQNVKWLRKMTEPDGFIHIPVPII